MTVYNVIDDFGAVLGVDVPYGSYNREKFREAAAAMWSDGGGAGAATDDSGISANSRVLYFPPGDYYCGDLSVTIPYWAIVQHAGCRFILTGENQPSGWSCFTTVQGSGETLIDYRWKGGGLPPGGWDMQFHGPCTIICDGERQANTFNPAITQEGVGLYGVNFREDCHSWNMNGDIASGSRQRFFIADCHSRFNTGNAFYIGSGELRFSNLSCYRSFRGLLSAVDNTNVEGHGLRSYDLFGGIDWEPSKETVNYSHCNIRDIVLDADFDFAQGIGSTCRISDCRVHGSPFNLINRGGLLEFTDCLFIFDETASEQYFRVQQVGGITRFVRCHFMNFSSNRLRVDGGTTDSRHKIDSVDCLWSGIYNETPFSAVRWFDMPGVTGEYPPTIGSKYNANNVWKIITSGESTLTKIGNGSWA